MHAEELATLLLTTLLLTALALACGGGGGLARGGGGPLHGFSRSAKGCGSVGGTRNRVLGI